MSGLATEKDGAGNITAAYATKSGKATVTATSKDGGNKKYTVKFTIKNDAEMKYSVIDHSDDVLKFAEEDGVLTTENIFAAGLPLRLVVSGKNGGVVEHKLSVKGAAKPTLADENYDGKVYLIEPTAAVTEITITAGKEKTLLRIKNTKIFAGKGTISVSASNLVDSGWDAKKGVVKQKEMKGKIFSKLYYNNLDAYKAAGSFNKVSYYVKSGKAPLAGATVLLSTTDDELDAIFQNNKHLKRNFAGNAYMTQLDANGCFTVDYVDANGKLDIADGKHLFKVTPVDESGNAIDKTVTITVTAAPAPKAKVKMAGTIKDFGSEAEVSFTTMNNIVFIGNEATTRVIATCGINSKGKISGFGDMFVVSDDGRAIRCESLNKEDSCYNKKNGTVTGIVTYTWQNLDGSTAGTVNSCAAGRTKITLKPAAKGEITPAPTD